MADEANPAAGVTPVAATPAQTPAAAPPVARKPNPWAARGARPAAPAARPVAAPVAAAPATPVARPPEARRADMRTSKEIRTRDAELERLRPLAADAAADRAALADLAKVQLAALPAAAQTMVKKLAGDNPRATIQQIAALQEAGLLGNLGAAPGATTGHQAEGTPSGDPLALDKDVQLFRNVEKLRADGKTGPARLLEAQYPAALERGRAKASPKSTAN